MLHIMEEILKNIKGKPDQARFMPFFIFLVLTAFQGMFGESSIFWMYALKTIVGAWMVWVTWDVVKEMRWAFSWEAVVVGIGVFVIWVGLDGYYPPIQNVLSWEIPKEKEAPWNPFEFFSQSIFWAWFFVVVRIAGSTLVVPFIEEVFYRSFVYRWLIREKFEEIPLGQWDKRSFLITGIIFGLVHFEWLPGILCGFAYQFLVVRKKRLGDAMTAHAITNFLIGVYVVVENKYHFW